VGEPVSHQLCKGTGSVKEELHSAEFVSPNRGEGLNSMDSITASQTASRPPGFSEESIAHIRRVKHLRAIVREDLGPDVERDGLEQKVASSLYHHHPSIRLEDALELKCHLKEPSTEGSTDSAIKGIVDEACTLLESWGRLGQTQSEDPNAAFDY